MASKRGKFQILARPVTILGHVVAMAVAALILAWILHFREGVALKSANKLKILNVSLALHFLLSRKISIFILNLATCIDVFFIYFDKYCNLYICLSVCHFYLLIFFVSKVNEKKCEVKSVRQLGWDYLKYAQADSNIYRYIKKELLEKGILIELEICI